MTFLSYTAEASVSTEPLTQTTWLGQLFRIRLHAHLVVQRHIRIRQGFNRESARVEVTHQHATACFRQGRANSQSR